MPLRCPLTTSSGFKDRCKALEGYVIDSQCSPMRTGVSNLIPDLRELYIQHNFLTTLKNETFERYPRLRVLTLDNNNISRIEEGAFSPLKNLFRFSIAYNLHLPTLKKSMFSSQSLTDFNAAYSNVKTFAGNEFTAIDGSAFHGLKTLKRLDLSRNYKLQLTYLDSNLFKYLSSLRCLDASENRISGLNHSTIEPLARLTTLGLSLNPLVCFVLIFAVGLIYYQRWWVRYQLFLLKLCFIGYEEVHDDVDRGEFQYDIAIMLDEIDNEWVNQHLRPALMERGQDFNRIVCGDEELMLGMFYLDAVHYATEKSFKTIFVISHAALQDQWFMMKFRTVLDHVNDVGTEKMILVFVEDVEDDELPFLIRLFLSDHRPYLVWPDDERGQEYFWEELIRDLTVNIRCNHLIPPN
eukprot:XP_011672601.1 PREDICTED: toll-like receptor 2 type-2 [Strongylocentrotus purpuratus]